MMDSNSVSRPLVSILVVAVLTGLLGAGCSTGNLVRTDYKAEENVTEYKTNQVSLSGTEWGSGYGSSKSLEVWAQAQCRGQDCRPNQVTLIFQVSGSGSLRMQNRAVELKANGETIGITRRRLETGRDADEVASALGVVATLEVPFKDFRTIAETDRLSGTIGTTSFRLRHQRRAPFRALVQKVTAPAEAETSEGSS